MGNRNLNIKIYGLQLNACILFVALCFFVPFGISAESDIVLELGLVREVLDSAKLKEEINLSGVTLDKLIEKHPNLAGLKQINVKTYGIPEPPNSDQIEEITSAYTTWLVEREWQAILRRTDSGRTVLLYAKEEDWIREFLLIILISPLEISEMFLVGEIELSALDELRGVILESVPKFGGTRSLDEVLEQRRSPSQEGGNDIGRLEEIIKTHGDETPIEIRYRLATEYQQFREYEEALEQYNYIISALDAPEWVLIRSYHGAAQSSIQIGDVGGAKRYYEVLLERFGTESNLGPVALDFLERVNRTQERASNIERMMDKADRIFSGTGEYEEAIEIYQDIVDSMPESSYASSALLKMGIAYGYLNRMDNKIATFEKALKGYPSAINHLYLGKAYQEDKRYPEALNQYETIISDYPDTSKWYMVDAYLGAGECLESLSAVIRESDTEKAESKLKQAKDYYSELLEIPNIYENPKLAAIQKKLILMERGDSIPFLGLGFRHTGAIKGAHIVTIFKNGPCNDVGIQPGDILLSIDSKPTPNPRSVIRIMGNKNIGDRVTLLIQRDGENLEIPVVLGKMPEKLER